MVDFRRPGHIWHKTLWQISVQKHTGGIRYTFGTNMFNSEPLVSEMLVVTSVWVTGKPD